MDQKLLEQKLSIVNNKDFVLNLIAKLNINDNDKTIGVAYWNSPVVYYAIKKLYPDKKVYYIEDNEIAGMYGIPAEYSIYLNVEKEYFPNMNFDKIIMNPPFKKDLHLKVLNEARKHLCVNGKIVSIQPARWLLDPLKNLKKSSDFKKNQEIFKHIESLDILSANDATNLFGGEGEIGIAIDLGIYILNTQTDNKLTIKQNSLIDKLFTKNNKMTFNTGLYKDNKDKNFVCLCTFTGKKIRGQAATKCYNAYGAFINGKSKNNLTYEEEKANNPHFTVGSIDKQLVAIFDTPEEAINFYNSITTVFWRYVCFASTVTNLVPLNYLPWMPDYKKAWTNEDYYKFFNITEEEQIFIEETMKEYI